MPKNICHYCKGTGYYEQYSIHGNVVRTKCTCKSLAECKPKVQQVELCCTKCESHFYLKEQPGWIEKVSEMDCPECGEDQGWDGRFTIIGYRK